MQDRSTLFFYHIYPLGACGAPEANDFTSAPVGRLRDLLTWIPHIKILGCNALYLGPVFESDFHGYDTADYFTVDRRLGTNSTLKELSRALHDAGITFVLDTVFNHVGRNFWAFKDLQAHGESSIYKDWFCGLDFTRRSSYNDAFYYDGWYDAYNLVKLNLTNSDVKRYLFSVVDFWEAEFGIAGLRLDVAEIMDKKFLAELAAFCRKKKKALWLLGEMISGDYNELANPDMLDSTTNYELYKSLYSSHNDGNYYELAHTLNRQASEQGLYRHLQLYTFVDNHDTTRIASILNNEQHLFMVYALLFTMPGIPSIYYGSEWGIKGIKGDHEDSALRPEVNSIPDVSHHALFLHIQRLAGIRAQCPALRLGNYKELFVSHHQLIFSRTLGQEVCIIAVNNTAQSISLTIGAIDTNVFVDQLNTDYRAESKFGVRNIEILSYGVRILTPPSL